MFEQIDRMIDTLPAHLLKAAIKQTINDFLSSLVDGLAEAMRTEPPT